MIPEIPSENWKIKPKNKTTQYFSEELKTVFSKEDIDLIIAELNNTFRHFKRLIKNSDLSNPEIQKNVFCDVLWMLNDVYNNYWIKKIWNNIPNLDVNDYDKLNFGEQVIHNVYKRNRNRLENKKIEWWSCRFRSLMFKKFFDELQDIWMNISSYIFMHKNKYLNPLWWHSWVCISFQWTEYLIDFWEINKKYGDTLIQSIDEINKKSKSKNFDKYKAKEIWKHENLMKFPTRASFLEELDKIECFEGWIILSSKIDNLWIVQLFFAPDCFSIQSKKWKKYYFFNKDIGNDIDNIQNSDLLDYVLNNIENTSEYINNKESIGILDENTKNKLKEKLSLILGKIDLLKLRKIIKW